MSAPRVEGYTIEHTLGEGAHARVFAARDAQGREVALKVLERRADQDPAAAERMVREAEVLASLTHPGVVRLYDAGVTEDGAPYLAMEPVDGRTLRARIDAEGPLPSSEAWSLVRQLALALGAVHARGVLHRDLTSGNVLIDARGRPRLVDFGLAHRVEDPRLSRDGAATGTPAYMAPEQWWGAGLDERTDVYGLGGLLYECLTGVPPWHGEDPDALLHRVATAEPRAPREREVTALAPAVEAFVMRCLAREARRRPADVATFVREGDAAFARRSIAARAEPWAWALAIAAAPFVLGYAGTRDPRVWVYESGFGGGAVLLSVVLAAALAPRFVTARPLLSLLPLAQGALGFATGMIAAGQHVETASPWDRFAWFHLGVAEASAGWFLGAAGSAAVLTLVALIDLPRERPTRLDVVAALVALGAGALALAPGALLVGAVAAALVLRRTGARSANAIAAVGALSCVALLAWVTLASDEARLWDADLERAARAATLTELARAKTATLGASAIALLALIGRVSWRGVRAWPRTRVMIGAAGALVIALALLVPWLAMRERRAGLTSEVTDRISVWADLDPPPIRARSPVRLGPTLQIGRAQVAIDGAPVAPTEALFTDTGALVVAQRLGPRLALGQTPQLVVAADRTLPSHLVLRALRAAHDLGVRRVDVVLLPGPSLEVSPSAPAEAALVVPRDLHYVEVALVEDPRAVRAGDEPFERLARALVAAPRLYVGAPTAPPH